MKKIIIIITTTIFIIAIATTVFLNSNKYKLKQIDKQEIEILNDFLNSPKSKIDRIKTTFKTKKLVIKKLYIENKIDENQKIKADSLNKVILEQSIFVMNDGRNYLYSREYKVPYKMLKQILEVEVSLNN